MKIAVIGLGSFGFQLAKTLSEYGHEVTAIDLNRSLIDRIKSEVSLAVLMNSTNKEDLIEVGIGDMDTVIVSLGPELEPSILTVHYLTEIGIKRIVAKALSEDHAKILEAVGATEVIYPERDMAKKTALRISHPGVLEFFEVTTGVQIQEIAPPESFIGKTLKELDLINKFGIQILAIREIIPEKVTYIPKADFIIKPSDILIVIGEENKLMRLSEF